MKVIFRLAVLVSLGLAAQPAFCHVAPAPSRGTGTVGRENRVLIAQYRDIVDTAAANGSFKTLVQLLKQAGITEDLKGFGRFTVFAPDDTAFAAVPPDILKILSANSDLLAKVLTYYVVANTEPYLATDLKGSLRTLERSKVTISSRNGSLYVNDARITKADVPASNGVIHVIDKVLIPDDVLVEIRKLQSASTP